MNKGQARNVVKVNTTTFFIKTRLCIQIILVPRKQRRLNGKYVFLSLYPFYFIILAVKTATQITNIILPTWKRGYVYIIRVPQKQRRLNDESVYIIISFLLHYSGCQNRHANYKHNTSNLKTRLCIHYTCTTKTKTT